MALVGVVTDDYGRWEVHGHAYSGPEYQIVVNFRQPAHRSTTVAVKWFTDAMTADAYAQRFLTEQGVRTKAIKAAAPGIRKRVAS
jgi:hypothetical protein